jgi:ubiquinone/menaquinone biosynthesis C-methylase UbiE
VPSIEENLRQWNEDYDWQLAGDSWSRPWGSAADQWYGCIYPRIRRFLPASSILEIAPGFGRWAQFLIQYSDTFIGVDLAPKCVDACRRRFADHATATFEVNDGHSLPMVSALSVDFAFSFDSLVHAEAEARNGYLTELARVLAPQGVAFVHHSNFGSYQRSSGALAPFQHSFDRLPPDVRKALARVGIYRSISWRAESVSASHFAELCQKAGLRCVGQELINWAGGVVLLDSFSIVTRPGSPWDHANLVVKNRLFRSEARSIRRSSSIHYTSSPTRI